MDTRESSALWDQTSKRVRDHAKSARRPLALEEWIARWDRFVTYLESGYDEQASFDDYAHELWKRDKVQELLDALPADNQGTRTPTLEAIDERFKRVTRLDRDDPLQRFFEHGPEWWWYRLPLHLPKQMASVLEE